MAEELDDERNHNFAPPEGLASPSMPGRLAGMPSPFVSAPRTPHGLAPSSPSPSSASQSSQSPRQFTRRPSDDDFTKMTQLSMRGGGFVAPRGGTANSNIVDPDMKLPEIPETPFEVHSSTIHHRPGAINVNRSQSERYRPNMQIQRNGSDEELQLPPGSALAPSRMPSRIPSFRIPSKLRVLPNFRGRKNRDDDDDDTPGTPHGKDTYVDETLWNDEPSGGSGSPGVSPQREEANARLAATWSFGSDEGLNEASRPRASTLDRRRRRFQGVDSGGPNAGTSSPGSSRMAARRTPSRKGPPAAAMQQSRLMSKRRSISDLNIPMSVQQSLVKRAEVAAVVSNPRQSIHFDESNRKSIGRWLAKFLLGGKYGEPSCHRIRRLSRDVVMRVMEEAEEEGEQVVPSVSRVLFVGECGVGKHELVRNFRNIGASTALPTDNDLLNDIASHGTSFSDNSGDEPDPSQLIAFEYNDRILVLEFMYADTEEEFVRSLIQKPADLIVAVYSVCSTSSLDFCMSMMDRLRNHGCEIPLALVGNKCDLVVARTVSKQETRAVSKQYGITLLEVSALLGEKCPELLLGVLRQLSFNKPRPRKISTIGSQQQQPDNSNPGQHGSKAHNPTIWSRLTKTFSNKQ